MLASIVSPLSTQTEQLPHLAIPIGDPAGIGTEVVLKALSDPSIFQKCRLTLIGTTALLETTYHHLRALGVDKILDPAQVSVLEVPIGGEIVWGKGTVTSGAASFAYLETGISRTLAGEFQGIVTGPIAKHLWQEAGYDYPGQTEVLAKRAGVSRFGMLFVARSPHTNCLLIVLLATTHKPLQQVPVSITSELMESKLDLLIESLANDFGILNPRVAIAGLNPHSGENGMLGTEERDLLIPWLERERQQRPNVQLIGPIPPDTMWVKPGQAWFSQGEHLDADAYLALYHDQGLIPVKLMAFDRAINTTIGLPFIRTSPDHGTGFDIAGKGLAKSESMLAAIHLAADLARERLKSSPKTSRRD